jgi:hypothetical protein
MITTTTLGPLQQRIHTQQGSLPNTEATATPCADYTLWEISLRAGPEGFTGQIEWRYQQTCPQVPFYMIPGLFYGQGCPTHSGTYPALGELNLNKFTSPVWSFAAERAALPVLLLRSGTQWVALEASPHYTVYDAQGQLITEYVPELWGDNEPQIGLALGYEAAQAHITIALPASEGPRRHVRNKYHQPVEKFLHLPPHHTVRLQLRLWQTTGDQRAYQPILTDIRQRLHTQYPAAEEVPIEILMATAVTGLIDWHWTGEYFVYTAAMDRSVEFNANNKKTSMGWHFDALGFVGGFPVAHGLLWYGLKNQHEPSVAIARQVIARWCREALTPGGLFWTSYHPGRAVTANGSYDNPAGISAVNTDATGNTPFYGCCWMPPPFIHARTTADASLYLVRLLKLLPPTDPLYQTGLAALRKNLAGILQLQDTAGRFGQIYHALEHRVAQAEGSAGVLWVAVLGEALELIPAHDPLHAAMTAAMTRAATAYLVDLHSNQPQGGPEDIGLAPASETGELLLWAYEAMYRHTPTPQWRQAWLDAAHWCLTWRKGWNHRFHPKNQFSLYQTRTRGGDYASSHNNHLHIWGLRSLGSFTALSQLTGDATWADAAHDHLRFATQLMCLTTGQWNGQKGMCTEQYYFLDWSIWHPWDPTTKHVQKGTFMGYSHTWCVAWFLLAGQQLLEVTPAPQCGK